MSSPAVPPEPVAPVETPPTEEGVLCQQGEAHVPANTSVFVHYPLPYPRKPNLDEMGPGVESVPGKRDPSGPRSTLGCPGMLGGRKPLTCQDERVGPLAAASEAARAADLKTADEWVDKTMATKKAKAEKQPGAQGITMDQQK